MLSEVPSVVGTPVHAATVDASQDAGTFSPFGLRHMHISMHRLVHG